MTKKVIVVHGGGPTAVINSSLYGVIEEAQKNKEVDEIYVAIGGTGGILNKNIKNITNISKTHLNLLLQSPASAIGTSRDALYEKDYQKILDVLKEYKINYVLMNGGNGTMDACGKLYEICKSEGINVIGIPKTMDNDISVTDHCPGFGSAARYMAASVAELCADVASLPIHIVVLESSGRNAGWVSAAASLASESYNIGPDLIYLPEFSFDEKRFLDDVSNLIENKGSGVVVVSEGLKNKDGNPIAKPIYKTERATYFGDVSSHLANLITKELDYKARSEKPGLLLRASIAWQSQVDRQEAIECGKRALLAAISGESGKMVAINRISTNPYEVEYFLVDIKEVMIYERKIPEHFVNKEKNNITDDFKQWCKPLIGSSLPKIIDIR